MNKYLGLLARVAQELKVNIPDPEVDCSIACLQGHIQKVADPIIRTRLQNQLKYLIQEAQNVSYDRSYGFPHMKRLVESIARAIPDITDRLCTDLGVPEFTFQEPVDRTPEQQTKFEEDRQAAIADYYKKSKKKARTEEEEKAAWEDVKTKLGEELKTSWNQTLAGLERELEKKELEHRLTNYERMDYSMYETLNRKKSILDETMQENIIVLRLDLDVGLSPIEYEELPTISSHVPAKGKPFV